MHTDRYMHAIQQGENNTNLFIRDTKTKKQHKLIVSKYATSETIHNTIQNFVVTSIQGPEDIIALQSTSACNVEPTTVQDLSLPNSEQTLQIPTDFLFDELFETESHIKTDTTPTEVIEKTIIVNRLPYDGFKICPFAPIKKKIHARVLGDRPSLQAANLRFIHGIYPQCKSMLQSGKRCMCAARKYNKCHYHFYLWKKQNPFASLR